ncbi:MAG: S41 family peptidase [Dysgonamonadaceae bacterium]|jgi:carboxyl-terminal processing protease|nr:S41 family peptidase [Dysgonamonadaceae bacterium]
MKNVFFSFLLSIFLVSCSYGQGISDPAIGKVNMTIKAIESLYVDTINRNKLAEDAIIALLQRLDPHSAYMTSEEVKEMNEPLQGNFEGVGIQFNMLTDTLYIVQVIPGGPSEKVGIMAGDRIIMVNDTMIAGVGMKNTDIMSRLRGPKGTVAHVKIMRRNNPNLISFKIIRDKIPIHSLDASYLIDAEIGYIKLNRFAATTYNEFKTALNNLQSQGMKHLILDLQDNGGGYLNSAIDIANEFLERGDLIVYTEGAHQRREEARSTIKGSLKNNKVIVLVNESSASASEIVSGALQDWDRAVLVGRRTFGKGLVQRPIPFPDGSMIKLTTARYYTPTGRSIQKPYESGNIDSYNMEVIQRYNKGEMISADSIHFPDSLKYNTLINRRTVYGGGGIMPDYFVPIDTTRFSEIHRALIASGVLNKFVMNQIDKYRDSYRMQYENFEVFKTKFNVNESMMNDLLEMFKKEDFEMQGKTSVEATVDKEDEPEVKKPVEITENQGKKTSSKLTTEDMKQFEKSKPLVKLQIKALIARDFWNMNEYYQIINEENTSLKKAIEIIKNPKEYDKLLSNHK